MFDCLTFWRLTISPGIPKPMPLINKFRNLHMHDVPTIKTLFIGQEAFLFSCYFKRLNYQKFTFRFLHLRFQGFMNMVIHQWPVI